MFEGAGTRVVRTGREPDDHDWATIKAAFTIPRNELPTLSLPMMLQKLDSMAEEMARGVAKQFYSAVSEQIDAGAGVTVDAQGQPISAELILRALAGMFIDFGRDGRPRWPQFHVNPKHADAAARVYTELETDKELRRRMDALIEKKREEWRAREASRSLVG